MNSKTSSIFHTKKILFKSSFLQREVVLDGYYPLRTSTYSKIPLLLINDGQDLPKMPFEEILETSFVNGKMSPVFCVGIHCATDRKNEYGTADVLDYKGRGAKAMLYRSFVIKELIPFIMKEFPQFTFTDISFAGFSLGALSALDIVWSCPGIFKNVGVFSGSFWWRDKACEDPSFDEEKNRIMHRLVREGKMQKDLKFFFQVGSLDETQDRNNNGVIDSIDDTLSLIAELVKKGYTENEINYVEIEDGHHDVPTWAAAFPAFLNYCWGSKKLD